MMQTLRAWEVAPRFNDVLRPGFRAWTPGLLSDDVLLVPDFYEDSDRLVVTLDLPGVASDDLDIEIEARCLSIRAARRHHQSAQWRQQTWTLPCTVDADQAFANLEDGVLTVILPKVAPRKVAIRPINGLSERHPPGALARAWNWLRGLFS